MEDRYSIPTNKGPVFATSGSLIDTRRGRIKTRKAAQDILVGEVVNIEKTTISGNTESRLDELIAAFMQYPTYKQHHDNTHVTGTFRGAPAKTTRFRYCLLEETPEAFIFGPKGIDYTGLSAYARKIEDVAEDIGYQRIKGWMDRGETLRAEILIPQNLEDLLALARFNPAFRDLYTGEDETAFQKSAKYINNLHRVIMRTLGELEDKSEDERREHIERIISGKNNARTGRNIYSDELKYILEQFADEIVHETIAAEVISAPQISSIGALTREVITTQRLVTEKSSTAVITPISELYHQHNVLRAIMDSLVREYCRNELDIPQQVNIYAALLQEDLEEFGIQDDPIEEFFGQERSIIYPLSSDNSRRLYSNIPNHILQVREAITTGNITSDESISPEKLRKAHERLLQLKQILPYRLTLIDAGQQAKHSSVCGIQKSNREKILAVGEYSAALQQEYAITFPKTWFVDDFLDNLGLLNTRQRNPSKSYTVTRIVGGKTPIESYLETGGSFYSPQQAQDILSPIGLEELSGSAPNSFYEQYKETIEGAQ